MCMISLPVEKVDKTNIFVGLNSTKTRQITVYSNIVSNYSDGNAMVIPVPYPQTVKFHNMSYMVNFFQNVDKSFYKTNSNSLEVIDLDNYRVSLALNFSDLSRLNKQVFLMSEGLSQMLLDNYKENYWGFIVFVLENNYKEYNPFSYSHNILNNQIYIPTRHYHSHDSKHYNSHDSNTKIADDWSHNIYLFNCGISGQRSRILQSMLNQNYNFDYIWNNNLYWDRKKMDFDLMETNGFEKYHIEGSHPNIDLMLKVQ